MTSFLLPLAEPGPQIRWTPPKLRALGHAWALGGLLKEHGSLHLRGFPFIEGLITPRAEPCMQSMSHRGF